MAVREARALSVSVTATRIWDSLECTRLTPFIAYDGPESASQGAHWSDREGVIELTHNYGSENDDNFQINNGNKEPGKGFVTFASALTTFKPPASGSRMRDTSFKRNSQMGA